MRGCDLRIDAFAGRALWLVSLFLIAPLIAHAEQLPLRTYTAADGLGSSYVSHIMRDSRGFMWFSTRNGLSRFDGYRFFTYNTEHGLPSPTINYMIETRGGVYWIATNGGGVCRFNPEASLAAAAMNGTPVFNTYPVGDRAATNNANVLIEDRSGTIWVGTDDGLFRLEQTEAGGVFRRFELPMLPPAWRGIHALMEDREGHLWIGTSWGLVRRLPDGQLAHYGLRPSETGDLVSNLLADREGRLWVGHKEGLLLLTPEPDLIRVANRGSWFKEPYRSGSIPQSKIQNPKSKIPNGEARWYTAADGLAGNSVGGLLQSSDGRLWIGTIGGLSEFDGKQFRSYTTAHGLSDQTAWRLAEDTDGNLWIGSRNGAMKLTPHGFTTYDEADGLRDLRIHSLFADAAGDTLVVSGDWFIHRFDGNRFAPTQPRLPGNVTYSWLSQVAFLDRAGGWWMLTDRGLYSFNKVSRLEQLARRQPDAIYTTREGLANNRLLRLYEDARGDLWISVYGRPQSGLARLERATGRLQTYSESDGLPSTNSPTAFCEDRSGNLWIGFSGGGLARYTAGRFTLFTVADGLPAGAVTALYLDRIGRLWLATNKSGLTRIDEPTADRPHFVTLTTADGLSTNNIRCITEDQWGHIYVGTARGVDRIDPETGHIRRYTTTDGLANDFVTAALRDRHGALWFGTLRGLSRLVPAMDRPRSPGVSIGGLRINGKSYPVAETGQAEIGGLELEPQQNQIQIDFFSLSFAPGEVLHYQYRMEGTNQDWSAPSEQRTVDFASLQPGTYRFLARAVSADGTASAPASVAFTIAPHVWQRWWFLTLASLLVGLAAYAVYRLRVTRLLELERMRMRIATDLHDDIGSSLSQIAILSEVALGQAENGGNRPARQLSHIARISRESVDSISDIVWAINPQRDWLVDLIGRMRRLAGEVFAARNVEFRFDAPPPERDIRLGTDVRRQVFLIFKEGINNMVRHSGCTRVDITVTAEGGWLMLKLSDNGRGFDTAAKSSGHGLMSMRKRAEALGGQLDIASKIGEGTTITLRVPRPRHTLRTLTESAKSKHE
jgi:ligand-binding sensor domain-containing protein/signal transduction histidine kinase